MSNLARTREEIEKPKMGNDWHGQFFYRCGTYGWLLVGDSEGLLVCEHQCFKHLDNPIKRRWTPKEKRIRKLESVLSKLIESKNFAQCVKIQKQIDINEAMED